MRPKAWSDAFIADMKREGIPTTHSRKILRIATTLQRLAEAQCNGDFPADHGADAWPTKPCKVCETHWHASAIRKDGRCVDCHATDKAKALVPEGWTAEFQGDPRGCVMKLRTPAGREIGVP